MSAATNAFGAADRVERERARYDQGIDRTRYQDLLVSHAGHLHGLKRRQIAKRVMSEGPMERALEIGCSHWDIWLERGSVAVDDVYCINISRKEMDWGLRRSTATRLKPKFLLMDAHKLAFPDAHFDVVFGAGILHHLELETALREIGRVLRPGGRIVFSEPLDNNPVGRLVRRLTPSARTEDETPFRFDHLATLGRRFECEFHYEQMLSVPAGILSRALFKSPDNPLTRLAFRCDELVQRGLPGVGPYFRKVTIVGRKPATAA
jgi:SAM-dependent methyltransferase